MKLFIPLLLSASALATPVIASEILGYGGIEPDTPISGQEDVVIYNLTGPTWGCSTPSSTPVCTALTFDNAFVTINGTLLALGNIAPGSFETLTLPGGTFPDGGILKLSFSATLSTGSLVDDLSNAISVDTTISPTVLPVTGDLGAISAEPLEPLTTPEPSTSPLVLFLSGVMLFQQTCWGRLYRKRCDEAKHHR